MSFHWARALGTAWQRTAEEPCSRYPGLHSNRTIEPAENSEPILLPYLGSGTELHCVSLVRGTAAGKAHNTAEGSSPRRTQAAARRGVGDTAGSGAPRGLPGGRWRSAPAAEQDGVAGAGAAPRGDRVTCAQLG